MIRVFLDSSVFFSGCLSSTGASHEILQLATQKVILLVIGDMVIQETQTRLSEKYPHILPTFRQYMTDIPFEMVDPAKSEVALAAKYTDLGDAPIVAGAIEAKVDYLVSLDRRDLVGVELVSQRSGLNILLPSQLLDKIRTALSQNP